MQSQIDPFRQVESLRLTAIYPTELEADPTSWWSQVVGQSPEREVSRPREGQAQVDGLLDRPDIPNARLVLQILPSRVDWLLVVDEVTPQGFRPVEDSFLGEFSEVLSIFLDMLRTWVIESDVTPARLALGAVLRLPVENTAEGNRVISRFLPFNVAPESTDFLYRINRPTVSSTLGDRTTLNRLATWTVIQVQTFLLAVATAGQTALPEQREGTPPFFACRLELDINTGAERTSSLPTESLGDLLEECSRVARNIAERGEPHDD